MTDRFAALRSLPRPRDAVTVWLEVDPEGIHFLDAIFSSSDGTANVRREYRDEGHKSLFKLYVAPGCVPEAERLLRVAGRFITIGEVRAER